MHQLFNKKILRSAGAVATHPALLSFYVSVLVIVLFVPSFSRYKGAVKDSFRCYNGTKVIYDDLENDGFSDMVTLTNSNIGTAGLSIRLFPSGFVDQWDMRGQFRFESDDFFFSGDYDGDGKKEIYAFTLSKDTIYLHGISDFRHHGFSLVNRFIAKVGVIGGKSDIRLTLPRFIDVDGDRKKELIFSFEAGFSEFPRAIFIYDIRRNTLLKSPELGLFVINLLVDDVIGDGGLEFIPGGYGPKNIVDRKVEFHDSSSWAMVLTKDLKFLFPPVEFPGRLGSIEPFVFPRGKGHQKLNFIYRMPPAGRSLCWFYRFDNKGKVILHKEMKGIEPDNALDILFNKKTGKEEFIGIPTHDGRLYYYDSLFNFSFSRNLNQRISYLWFEDTDLDGTDEALVYDDVSNTLTIFRDDFRNPAVIRNIRLDTPSRTRICVKKQKKGPNEIVLDSGDIEYTLSYTKNPMFYGRFGIYFLIYAAIFLFTLLVMRIQRLQLQKRFTSEKKINELQLKIVRNQMDPHFTMNAINSVIDAVNRNEKEAASENLMHFSRMYRSLVLSADKIKRSLKEELEFTENYLALEKFRFHERFDYTVEIAADVKTEWEIPKMVIQSPVENAVKHGILPLPVRGMIRIRCFLEFNDLIIELEDNGIGRKQAREEGTGSTGKGIQIMDQFLDLYTRITAVRVTYHVSDLRDTAGVASGTKVTVRISNITENKA